MIENWNDKNYITEKSLNMPVKILDSEFVSGIDEFMIKKEPCLSFHNDVSAKFEKKGAWILFDFGKEMCGSIRLITRDVASSNANFRITFGESVSEACSSIGEKNATNDHSPRDFTSNIATLSDLTFGLTGFRFVRLELLDETQVLMQNAFAVNILPKFDREAVIKTSDDKLNEIIETAAYTLKLNFQNGYIWDGIKRDRLVWCGDLHQEIVTSLYLFGDNCNIPNSLDFLKKSTNANEWINAIPTYSAWWVINICDYCSYLGDKAYFDLNREYAVDILERIDGCIDANGNINFVENTVMPFFLDWPSMDFPDAVIGTAMIFMLAADKYLNFEKNEHCKSIKAKLAGYLDKECEFKQTRAFQILAGRNPQGESEFLEKRGAAGFSTFMTYYILTADAMSGGKKMIDMIKDYYGGMLSRGATTFWEDFDLDWLEGSSRIDCLPEPGQRDIHGDYGDYCYKGFRHSLCHGWSSGVIAFIIENIFGIRCENGCKRIIIKPNAGNLDFNIKLPLPQGWLDVTYKNGELAIEKPDEVEVITD